MNPTRLLIVAGAALLLLIGSSRTAHACGQGNSGGMGNLLLAAAAIVTVDSGLVLTDLGSGLAQHHLSTGYGVFEAVFSAPQFALGLTAMAQGSGSTNTGLALYTAGVGLMLAHGIWTIATQPTSEALDSAASEPTPREEPRRRLALGLGPTYAAVGQLARPGFGVVGRF